MSKLERNRLRAQRERQRRRNLRLIGCAAALLALCLLIVLCCRACGGPGPEEPGNGSRSSGAGRSASDPLSIGSAAPAMAAIGREVLSSPEVSRQLADPLLVLVNEEEALPEDWQVDLAPVSSDSTEKVDVRILSDLSAMTEAARRDDVWFWVASGYRSVEDQQTILENAIERRMQEEGMTREEAEADALRTIQKPGHSEHHTGLVVDFNDVDDGFEETSAYRWLSQHAADYGFVQRYRQDKVAYTGIDNESWHYRYVGVEHAQAMERLDMCLEEYVEYVRDHS